MKEVIGPLASDDMILGILSPASWHLTKPCARYTTHPAASNFNVSYIPFHLTDVLVAANFNIESSINLLLELALQSNSLPETQNNDTTSKVVK